MRFAATLVFLLPFAWATGGLAQTVHYRNVPIGERAIGLGGAFTAIADDPSAAYYNPAGITVGGRFQFLGSLSSLVFNRLKIDNALRVEDQTQDIKSDGTTTLPRFAGTVVTYGRVKYGDHQFALAYSTLEPDRNRVNVTDVNMSDSASSDLRIRTSSRSKWFGLSFAGRVADRMSFGVSLYTALQRLGYEEDIGFATGGVLTGDSVRLGGESATTSSELSVKTYHLLARFGYLYRINPRWRIGAMFQPPGIPLHRKGGLFRRTDTHAGGESAFFLLDESNLSARMPIPFELRTGTAVQINDSTLLSADFTVNGPVRDGNTLEVPQEISDLGLRLGVYYSNSRKRDWAPNAAIGAEHRFGKAVVAGGLFTNISAAPDVPETTPTYTWPQVNLYGAAVSVGLDTKGYKLSVGANGQFGRGDGLSVRIDGVGQPIAYERTRATTGLLVVFIAGAVSIASKAAKDFEQKRSLRNGDEERDVDVASESELASASDTAP